ncbi:MAG: type II toxin-antitoxin system RelE family toxin [Microcystis aeruginosa]
MKINYLPTFIKDLKDLKSTSSYSVIKNLVFTDILAVKQLREINNLKKLKGEYNAYRIRIGDYRIVFFVEEDTITFTFARVLHRREFYRYFP